MRFDQIVKLLLLIGIGGSLALLTSSDTTLAVVTGTTEALSQDIVIDQQLLVAQTSPAGGAPILTADQATTRARAYAPAADTATEVTARYVLLTLRDNAGKVVWGVRARPVWLVTFHGVVFAPTAAAHSGCSCVQFFQRPSTAVALDATTGALVVAYGLD